jgi:hypothetical protein|tara:strand:- start:3000 stop:3302 length:303 start_codon:yes stop_codon:yes gene_type:complete
MADIIKHPPHYFRFKIEPITFIMQNEIPYAEGNAIKYICRWRHKHKTKEEQLGDLKKAIQYINLLIEQETQGKGEVKLKLTGQTAEEKAEEMQKGLYKNG